MATISQIPVLGQFFQTRNKAVHPNTCLNYYPELTTKSDSSLAPQQTPEVVLYPTHGTVLAGSLGGGSQVRGMLSYNGFLWIVIDNKFYQGTQTLSTGAISLSASLGTLTTSTGPVSLVTSGALSNQIFITDGSATKKYYNIQTTTFGSVTDAGAVATNQADYQDGYAAYVDPTKNQFYITNVGDLHVVNDLNFASTTSKGDNAVAVKFFKQYMCIWTLVGVEVWFNSGTTTLSGQLTTFPFSRVSDVYMDKGTNAPFSIISTDTALFWLSANDHGETLIVRAGGTLLLVPSIISTPAISSLLDSMIPAYQTASVAKFSDCISYCFTDIGHEFLVWTFPIGNLTIVYDNFTKLWHTWATGTVSNLTGVSTYGRHVSNCYSYLNGYHYVGDYASGNIYTLSSSTYTDNGNTITREITSSYVSNLLKRISVRRVELDVTGSTGSVTLYTSKDGGNTYVSQGAMTFGTSGAYANRVFWNLLGMARNWAFKFVTSSAVEHVLVNGIADLEEGDS